MTVVSILLGSSSLLRRLIITQWKQLTNLDSFQFQFRLFFFSSSSSSSSSFFLFFFFSLPFFVISLFYTLTFEYSIVPAKRIKRGKRKSSYQHELSIILGCCSIISFGLFWFNWIWFFTWKWKWLNQKNRKWNHFNSFCCCCRFHSILYQISLFFLQFFLFKFHVIIHCSFIGK